MKQKISKLLGFWNQFGCYAITKVPAFHFNTRFLVTDDSWFGGGADMTLPREPKGHNTFHRKMKESCDSTDKNYYKEFKKNCDEYFYLPHREEARG